MARRRHRVPRSEKRYPGTIVRAETSGGVTTAERLPWTEAVTRGEVGVNSHIVKQKRDPVPFSPEPITKRTDRARADDLALRFVHQLKGMEVSLGRPLEPADLSDEWLRAFGLQMWKAGTPVTVEAMRAVAENYLEAVKRGSSKDSRWTPDAVSV